MGNAHTPDIHALATRIQPELLRVLATLPRRRQTQVLDFARFLGQLSESNAFAETGARPKTRIELRVAPDDTLLHLTGLVTLGGDALADSEAIYDDNSDQVNGCFPKYWRCAESTREAQLP